MQEGKLLTRNYVLLFIANLLLTTSFYMLLSVLPIFGLEELQISPSMIGLMMGIFSVSAILLRPFIGSWLDNYGRLVVYIPVLILFAICCGLYTVVSTLTGILALRVMHGIAWSGITTSNSTIVTDIVPRHLRGRGLGYAGLAMVIAMAIGPSLGLELQKRLDYDMFFIICTVLALAAIAVISMLRLPKVEKHVAHHHDQQKPKGSMFEKNVLGLAFTLLICALVYGSVMTFMVIHAANLGLDVASLYFLCIAITAIVLRPVSGKLLDEKGPVMLVTLGIIAMIVGQVLLAVADNSVVFLLSGIFCGASTGVVFPTLMAMGMNVVPANRRGVANATMFSAMDLGIGTGSVVFGVIAGKIGYSSAYMLSAVILAIPIIWYVTKEKNTYAKLSAEQNAIEIGKV